MQEKPSTYLDLGSIGKSALCVALEGGYGTMAEIAFKSAFTDINIITYGAAGAAIAFRELAIANGCLDNPSDPDVPDTPGLPEGGCCIRASEGGDLFAYVGSNAPIRQTSGGDTTSTTQAVATPGVNNDTINWRFTYIKGGQAVNAELPLEKNQPQPYLCIADVRGTASCEEKLPDGPLSVPIPYTDPTTGCQWTITVVDSYINSQGLPVLKYRAVANNPLECGGPNEWWYYPDGSTYPVSPENPFPPTPTPEPTPEPTPDPDPPGPTPDPDPPTPPIIPEPPDPIPNVDCCEKLTQMLLAQNKVLDGINTNLTNLMLDFANITILDDSKEKFIAPCDKDANDKPLEIEYQLMGGKGLFPILKSLKDNQSTLADLLQQHLNWKTPTCGGGASEVFDTSVTVRFVSTQRSSNGNDKLRKQFRYFSGQNKELEFYAGKWADFTWESGPAVVSHIGTKLGKPTVWAKDAAEAKRVIRKAFEGEGIDPDTEGEWKIGAVKSSRYGEVKTMVTYKREEYVWVTKRNGPSGSVELAPDV